MKRRALISLLAVPLASAILSPINALASEAKAQNKFATELFASSLPDIKGVKQSLSQWKGKILVVNFWATWCAPCIKEMPELSAFQQEVGSSKVQLLGIGIDEASNIAKFAQKYPVSYPLLVAGMGGSELSVSLGNNGGALPFTALIDNKGRVIKTYVGTVKINDLRNDIKKLR
jgi:thiol-disulfide isomerase/thioredoxin